MTGSRNGPRAPYRVDCENVREVHGERTPVGFLRALRSHAARPASNRNAMPATRDTSCGQRSDAPASTRGPGRTGPAAHRCGGGTPQDLPDDRRQRRPAIERSSETRSGLHRERGEAAEPLVHRAPSSTIWPPDRRRSGNRVSHIPRDLRRVDSGRTRKTGVQAQSRSSLESLLALDRTGAETLTTP